MSTARGSGRRLQQGGDQIPFHCGTGFPKTRRWTPLGASRRARVGVENGIANFQEATNFELDTRC